MFIPNKFGDKWSTPVRERFLDLFQAHIELDNNNLSNIGFHHENNISDLSGLSLMGCYDHPTHITNCNFYMSYFKNCSFKEVIFRNVNFSQCKFEDCYFRRAIFIDCVFIGTRFINCDMVSAQFNTSRMRHVKIDSCYVSKDSFDNITTNDHGQEHIGEHYSKKEIYSQIKACCYACGDFEKANYFKEKEVLENLSDMKTRRQYFDYLIGTIFAKISGYGYKPLNVFYFSLLVIIAFTFIYLNIGIKSSDDKPIYWYTVSSPLEKISPSSIFASTIKSLYFSIVTFTTLGYGDFSPLDRIINYIVTPFEAILGALCISLFVVVLYNRYFRG